MRGSHSFYQNTDCEYFPCHDLDTQGGKGEPLAAEDFSCLFCYCPLYALGRGCGGECSYDNEAGVKDCSGCLLPHRRENYEMICRKAGELVRRMAEQEKE